ncbi:MAG: mycothiol synthase [Pseudonocardiales bacterium]|nr:mycothiol synthase [Pseudonocardiales bacterium]
MIVRSASMGDLAAITALQRRWDVAAFGDAEHDESEVREELERIRSFDEHSRLVFDGDRLIAAAWRWSTEATLLIEPGVDPQPLHAELLSWFEQQQARALSVLSTDERLRAALGARGWRHTRSTFELLRSTGPDWEIPEPAWDPGIVVGGYRAEDAAALYHLIYVDAAWADVPGHHPRAFDEWRDIFITDATVPEHQVLAWRGERLVGASLGRMYTGDVGWIAQLAVARDQRGRGLGRALLVESLRRRAVAGAKSLGLGVLAENRAALQLYLDVGLRIDREWQDFEPPR